MDNISDKRASKRRNVNGSLAFSYFNHTYSYDAKILNCGAGGMCFQSERFLSPGATLCIRVKDCQSFSSREERGDSLPCISLAEVKWCNQLPGVGSVIYDVGVNYLTPAY